METDETSIDERDRISLIEVALLVAVVGLIVSLLLFVLAAA